MPSIRIGFATDFNLLNELVGIGTTIPTARLDVVGAIRADNSAGGGGVSTITRYDGFSNSLQTLGNTVSIAETSKGNLNSISGEIIIPDGKTITVADGVSIGAGRLDSLTVLKTFDLPSGGTSGRVATSERGSTRYNEDLGQLEFYTGYEWRTVRSYDGSGRGRGVFAGGYTPAFTQVIDYVNISTFGNAVSFGELDTAKYVAMHGFADSTRGLFNGGYKNTVGTGTNNEMHYITIASTGNSIDFGDLIGGSNWGRAGASSSTRGISLGGYGGAGNVIDYVQIQTIGNALDFGDLLEGGFGFSAMTSPTRCVISHGYGSSKLQTIQMSSKGNSVTFGNSSDSSKYTNGGSNSTRGIFYSASTPAESLLYTIIISTFGNAVEFGELAQPKTGTYPGGIGNVASNTRLIFGGGQSPAADNRIDVVLFSTYGTSQDFGDLTVARAYSGACSDSHGGLGGF